MNLRKLARRPNPPDPALDHMTPEDSENVYHVLIERRKQILDGYLGSDLNKFYAPGFSPRKYSIV